MKAQAIDTLSRDRAPAEWRGGPPTIALGLLAQARGLEIVATLATRLALSLVPALTIVVGTALAVSTPGMESYLQALLWTGGFLFYALAIESDRPATAGLLVATGLAVQALTWLSGHVAPELGVAAATLVAAWVAGAIARFVFRRP